MRFFRSNSVDDPGVEYEPKDIARMFWESDAGKQWAVDGGNLQRCFTAWLMVNIGGWMPGDPDATDPIDPYLDAVYETRPTG